MIVFRLCNENFNNDISGHGAKLYGGRWNSKSISMLYTSEHASLAILEMLVHNHFQDFDVPLSLLTIFLPDFDQMIEIKNRKLKKDWINDVGYTNFIGNEFIKNNNNLYLKIPSAVVTDEHNFIINPQHNDFKKVKIMETKNFKTDKRLFSI